MDILKRIRLYFGIFLVVLISIHVLLASSAFSAVILNESFDSGTLPAGWGAYDYLGSTANWRFDNPGERTNLTGGAGNFAIADSDYYGTGVAWSVNLITPALDMSNMSTVTLEFKTDFNFYSGNSTSEVAQVDVSTNGLDGPWSTVWQKTADYRGPVTETVDLTSLTAGQSNVMVRFFHWNAEYDWWWQVDDVVISGCLDSDNDGYGLNGDSTCPNGTSIDCNDNDSYIKPGAVELCDTIDNDCNAGTADGSAESWYNQSTSCGTGQCAGNTGQYECRGGGKVNTCDPLSGAVTEGPLGDSTCSDTIDNDCDGALDDIDSGCFVAPQETYEFKRMWPVLHQPWYFNQPNDVAIDGSGFIYIADEQNHRIQKFTADGQMVTMWGSNGTEDGNFKYPSGIAIDHYGFVYVADSVNNRVQKFTSDGQFVTKWPGKGRGIAVDGEGHVYVAGSWSERVMKFDSDGTFLKMWGWGVDTGANAFEICTESCQDGVAGDGDGQFEWPTAIAVDSSGFVYVADENNHRVQKFDSDGQFIRKWGSECLIEPPGSFGPGCNSTAPGASGVTVDIGDGQFYRPAGIEVDGNGIIYVSDTWNSRVQTFNSDGEYISKWGGDSIGWEDGQFSRPGPYGLAIDRSGFVYVAENTNRIQKFTSDGEFTMAWESWGANDDQFFAPTGVAFDTNGFIYVADGANNRIKKYDSNLTLLEIWGWGVETGANQFEICTSGCKPGIGGSGADQFSGIAGIAVDGNGKVYVSNSWNFHFQIFTSEGVLENDWFAGIGSGDGEFDYGSSFDMEVDSNGFIYVIDKVNDRIQKFDSNGTFVLTWGWGVATGSNVLEVCTANCRSGIDGTGDGQFENVRGIAIDSIGMVYVADRSYESYPWKERIQKFDSNGNFIMSWESHTETTDTLTNGAGIDVDSSGFVYVAYGNNHEFRKFTPDGELVGKWGGLGSGPGFFKTPFDVAVLNDGRLVVSDNNHRVQVFSKVTSTGSKNKVIMVAGGGKYSGNKLWNATRMNTNFAYNALLYQGFTKDRIYYMSEDNIDLDNNAVLDDIDDDTPTVDELGTAITSWAAQVGSEITENVIIYIADHGASSTFRISRTELLDADQLNTWVNTLQQTITGHVIVIIDSCESGSFQSVLTGTDRIILTSTSPGEKAYFVNQGSVSYSNFFWTGILNGNPVLESHNSAVDALKDTIGSAVVFQNPLINDSTGNADTIPIGNGTDYYGTAPQIGSVSAVMTGTNSAKITAVNVTDNERVTRVWAVILPPGFNMGASNNAVKELPIIDLLLTATAGTYEASYEYFDIQGTYQIAVYAKDRKGDAVNPKLTSLSVGTPKKRKAIIVAAGPDTSSMWPAIETNVKTAYEALSFQGYTDDEIYLLSPSGIAGVSKVPVTPVLSNLKYAVETWAVTNAYDLVLYMIGDGDGDSEGFYINDSETLLADNGPSNYDLDTWLDTLQGTLDGIVTVVYDASYSGSYLSALASPPTGKKRVFLGSSGGRAFFLSDGDTSFSKYFWIRILNGWNVRDAFYHARSAMEFSTGQEQKAWLDDNGNGTGNERGDGAIAANYTIGVGIVLAGKDPLIGAVTADPPTVTGALSSVVHANDVTTIGTLATINPVWAVITHPKGPGETSATQTTVVLNLAGDDDYEGPTGDILTNFGRYEVSVFAKDDEGNISSVSQTTIYQLGRIDKYEDDDAYEDANVIKLNYPDSQQHNFYDNGDEDWVMFYGISGQPYTISATNLGENCDTVLELYIESDLNNPVEDWNNAGNGIDDIHDYTVLADGIYYLKVRNSNPAVFGNDTGYDLDVYIPDLPTTYGVVNGTVTDTDHPETKVGGAIIISSRTPLTAMTDSSGAYEFSVHDIGSYTLLATKSGYSGESGIAFSVSNDNATTKDFTMAKVCTDLDGDNYGSPGSSSCSNGNAYDCNDGNAAINPGAEEVCDSYDNDCDGEMNEGFDDTDGDGIANCVDSDDDNDGIPDVNDNCPLMKPVRIVGYADFSTIQEAYNDAIIGDEIQCQDEIIDEQGNVTFDDPNIATVTFKGGYDCSYLTNPGVTTINGNMTISKGKLIIDSGTLELQ